MSDVTTSTCQILVGQTWSMQKHGPTQLTCTAGALWVTVDADAVDHVLHAGQRMAIAADRHVVAEALEGTAVLEVTTPSCPVLPCEQTRNCTARTALAAAP